MRRYARRAAAILFLTISVSCASTGMFQLTPEEEAALKIAMETPLTFTVGREQSIASWDRARDFVDRYSTMKLRTVTDSLVQAYEAPTYTQDPVPVESGVAIRFGYSVKRTRVPEGIEYVVACAPSSKLGERDANQNAHLAAEYIRSGVLACSRCIVR